MSYLRKTLAAVVMLFGIIVFMPGVDADAATYEKKTLKLYNNGADDVRNIDCVFRDDMPHVPYVNIEEFLEILYAGSDYSVTGSGDVYQIWGAAAGVTGSAMTVDTSKETVRFDDDLNFPVGTVSELDGSFIYQEVDYPDGVKPVNYDLAKYGLDLYSENGKVYMPMSVAVDLNLNGYAYTDYVDGDLYLGRLGGALEIVEFISKAEEKYFDTSDREQDETDYAYKELCFRLTELYGYPERARSPEFVKRIKESGFSKALEAGGTIDGVDIGKANEYLKSTNKSEYAAGLMMLDCLLYDGGHTFVSMPFLVIMMQDATMNHQVTKDFQALYQTDQDVDVAMQTAVNLMMSGSNTQNMTQAREKLIGKPVKTWKNGDETVASLYISENTAVFSFDSFIAEVITMPSGEKPFNEALDLAKKKGCKNFAIDLAANTGGADTVVGYIMAMISKDNTCTTYLIDTRSGTKTAVKAMADRNFDGKVDEKDLKVSYDFNYAVLTSRYSFSCGNLLPAVAKEMGIPTVGETSGGGGCAIALFGNPVNGGMFTVSSGAHTMCYSDYTSIDGGVPVDIELVKSGQDNKINVDDLYDLYSLTKALNKQYGIALKANTMKVKAVTKTVSASQVASKKSTVKGAIKVSKAQGAVTYKKASGSKNLSVNKKGYVVVKKGTKSGTYKIKVKVKTDGTGCYKAASKTTTVTVRVA